MKNDDGKITNQSPPTDQKQQENEAANMASFGTYDYDPGIRAQTINTGWNYNTMNPPQGIGSSPYMVSPNGNIQPTYNAFRPNPVLQQQSQPTEYHIPGISMGGEYLPPLDIDDKLNDLQTKYLNDVESQEARLALDRQASGYNYGYNNYYGVAYYNPYQYNTLTYDLGKNIDQIKENAKQNRIDFNINMSKLAHNIAGHEYKEEDIHQIYNGRDVDIQNQVNFNPQLFREQYALQNSVPFDNSQFYRDQFSAASQTYRNIINDESDMQETFTRMGLVDAEWNLEEESHRRRNLSNMYNSDNDAYKYYVRKKAQERYAAEKGIALPSVNIQDVKQTALQQFPTLSNSATLADDGTLNVTCNFGSHKGETYSVVNSQEAHYQEKKQRFNDFLNTIAGSVYRNYNGQ